jgi:class 3 adenylate cyclase
MTRLGIPVEWEEEPFEWVGPHRFSVGRHYVRGPIERMRVTATLEPSASGGTHLVYRVQVLPRNTFGRAASWVQIGVLSRRRFAKVFRSYDAEAQARRTVTPTATRQLTAGARERLQAARRRLSGELADRLLDTLERSDDLTVARLRPYVLADGWGSNRRETLELCLEATRQGVLQLQWELLCPQCRGTASTGTSLDEAASTVHCDTCLIDFDADFERSIEVTFRPIPAIREAHASTFCVAGPQVTPHVVAQQLVATGDRRTLDLKLEPGGYRLRSHALQLTVAVRVTPDGAPAVEARLTNDAWTPAELELAPSVALELENATDDEQLIVLERTAWSDQSATAAEVTALQVYRDLFASEALRPGQPIAVGTLTVVFTDLRDSTRYYREVGDAPAFGAVLEHLDLLREAVVEEGGAVVKSMGDAIVAVFPRPVAAVRAMFAAQETVSGKPLALKVGIHVGPCIAVNQNGVLDYFGSTVNLASRLVSLSDGDDLVVSDAVLADPEVAAFGLDAERLPAPLRGFEDATLGAWRIRA